jgi:DNA-binding FrmR family transcriptional regulator
VTPKVIGQLESVLKGLNEDEQCSEILHRLAAARGAISSLMGELTEDHILNHMPKNSKSAEEAAEDAPHRAPGWGSQAHLPMVRLAREFNVGDEDDGLKAALFFLFVAVVFVPSSVAQSVQSEEPEANPGRPTVSTPATLTPVGHLQFETGALGAGDSPEFSSRFGLNEVMKLSITSRLELITSVEPFVHYRADGLTGNGTGEVFLGAQGVLVHGEGAKPTISASYLRRVYDGGVPELDFGSPRNSFLLLASAAVKGFHYDANAIFNEQTQGVVSRAQFGQTLSISHPVVGKLSLSGEIWHFTQPFLRGHAVGSLWAVSYAARKTLVFDAGFDHGLTGTSTRWEGFVGFTYLLPHRLW